MFKRVILESWHEGIPYLCFALIAGAFCVILFRALMMKKSEVERISRLPLDSVHESASGNKPRPSEKS